MKRKLYLTALLLATTTAAKQLPPPTPQTDEFTFSCLPLTVQRSDPIISPGEASDHTHIVAGGTAFQRQMGPDTAKNATDTTCGVAIDKSNYWVPQLYHRMRNGSYELIEGQSTAIYYFNRACNYTTDATHCNKKEYPLAPPAGLRVVAGDVNRRTFNSSDFTHRATSHMCISANSTSTETNHLPRQPCSLLRSQVFLPSCWDGRNLDSEDHQSHLSYPINNPSLLPTNNYNQGICPPSHPVALISIFLEFFFDTSRFPDYQNWVYANGDATGYGLHGDFVNGWEDQDALQGALRTCTGEKGLDGEGCSVMRGQKTEGKALTPVVRELDVDVEPEGEEEVGLRGPIGRLPGGKHRTQDSLLE